MILYKRESSKYYSNKKKELTVVYILCVISDKVNTKSQKVCLMRNFIAQLLCMYVCIHIKLKSPVPGFKYYLPPYLNIADG